MTVGLLFVPMKLGLLDVWETKYLLCTVKSHLLEGVSTILPYPSGHVAR